MKKTIFRSCMVAVVFSGVIHADPTLTFDDIGPTPPSNYAPIGNYGGFTWSSGFYYFHRDLRPEFANGVASGDYAAFNAGTDDYVGFTSSSSFDLVGLFLTSVDWAQQDITIEGYLSGGGNYQSIDIRIDRTTTWYDVNFTDIDEVYISSENYFAMDDLTVVPEPRTLFVLLLGGGLLGLTGRRKR